MPRFVILEHDHPQLHWDLMLEAGDLLRTWRLASLPEAEKTISATYLAEHRRIYLDYEGSVSGSRGSVLRWDKGTYSWLENQDDRLSFELEGDRVRGTAELIRGEG